MADLCFVYVDKTIDWVYDREIRAADNYDELVEAKEEQAETNAGALCVWMAIRSRGTNSALSDSQANKVGAPVCEGRTAAAGDGHGQGPSEC